MRRKHSFPLRLALLAAAFPLLVQSFRAEAQSSPPPVEEGAPAAGALPQNAALPGEAQPGSPTVSGAPLQSGSGDAAALDGSATPLPAVNCCPPPPGEQGAASPTPRSRAAASTAASAAKPATTAAEAAAAPTETFLRAPGLTTVPANRLMPPPPPPSEAAAADKRNWKALDAANVPVITLGEAHYDPWMMDSEGNFLASAYTHGFRNLVIEYPAAKQAALDRYFQDPTYQNMAELEFAWLPDIQDPIKRAQLLGDYTKGIIRVDTSSPRALAAAGLRKDKIAAGEARIQMYRLWRKAHQLGYRVVAADLDRNTGLDRKTGKLVSHPTDQQVFDYVTSGQGMRERNQLIAAAIAREVAAHGRTISIGGGAHTGFLPNERLSPMQPPSESYPGLNYLLGNQYGIGSIALVQRQVSPQGYLAEVGAGYWGQHPPSRAQVIQQERTNNGLDPFRVLIEPGQPIEKHLREAVERDRSMAVP